MIQNYNPLSNKYILSLSLILTIAIQRTMCSSMKLLKYWLRKRRPGPMKAVSGRYNSLLVMCAIWESEKHAIRQNVTKSITFSIFKVMWRHQTYHQLVGDLGDDHAEGQQVQTGMVLKQMAGWLLKNYEGQSEDKADVQTRSQDAGVLKRNKYC